MPGNTTGRCKEDARRAQGFLNFLLVVNFLFLKFFLAGHEASQNSTKALWELDFSTSFEAMGSLRVWASLVGNPPHVLNLRTSC